MEQFRDVSMMGKAMSDSGRLGILAMLAGTPMTVGEISAAADMSRNMTSYHLGILLKSGLVTRMEKGNVHLYSINRDGADTLKEFVDSLYFSREGLRSSDSVPVAALC